MFLEAARAVLLSACLVFLGCTKQADVAASESNKEPTPVPASIIEIDCRRSEFEKNLRDAGDSGLSVQLPRVCTAETFSDEPAVKQRPVLVVFALDTTESMQSAIDAVRDGVVELGARLEQRGWNPRFAAVAFRDPVLSSIGHFLDPTFELAYATKFLTAEEMQQELSTNLVAWRGMGGLDFQNGGQTGLMEALRAVVGFRVQIGASSESEFPDAAILYVSSSPAYRGRDHWNFGVDELATIMKTVPFLRVFHSTPSVVSNQSEILVSDARFVGKLEYRVVRNQIEDLRTKAEKPGSWLGFPLSRSLLVETFTEQFDQVKKHTLLDCFVLEASIRDLDGNIVARFSSENSMGEVAGENNIILDKSIRSSGLFTYQDKRCCVRAAAQPPPASCESIRDSTAVVRVK